MADDGRPLVLALLGDLMLESWVEEVAHRLGMRFAAVASLAALPDALANGAPTVVVLDLASPAFPEKSTLEALSEHAEPPRVLAFFPHVNRALGDAAREAGFALVVPRSRFVAEMPVLIQRAAGAQAVTGAETGS